MYAEDYLQWASEEKMCIDTDKLAIVGPPCDTLHTSKVSAVGLATKNAPLYERMIDAMSLRDEENDGGSRTESVYKQFFSSFESFRVPARLFGRALSAVRKAAAEEKISYIETQVWPTAAQSVVAVANVTVTEVPSASGSSFEITEAVLAATPGAILSATAEFNRFESHSRKFSNCNSSNPDSGCQVQIKYQVSVPRVAPPGKVFASLVFAFALVEADLRFVGVNLVAEEYHPVALRDYAVHMRMIRFLRSRYPSVHVSLHAGELTRGLVPPHELQSHVHDAVVVAQTNRIGHGTDIEFEENAAVTIQRMADHDIAVEISLTSSAVILGVTGRTHPILTYLAAGVPVVLSTDDAGVLRIDLTNEYVRAMTEVGLSYADLKRCARNALAFAFIKGDSLFTNATAEACASALPSVGRRDNTTGTSTISAECSRFLLASPKASLQLQLERDLAAFEAAIVIPSSFSESSALP